MMTSPMTATEILDSVFLETRAKLLEIGASLDRITRADDDVERYLRFVVLCISEPTSNHGTTFQKASKEKSNDVTTRRYRT